MSELTLDIVNQTVRPAFEKNVAYVDKYLEGKGFDMGCGSCPLLKPDCLHLDISPQPIAVEQVGANAFFHADATLSSWLMDFADESADYVFSSHMVEDLPSRDAMADCLNSWKWLLRPGGHIVLLIPDMEGGRYPKVGEPDGNCSHKVDVGKPFFVGLLPHLPNLKIVQIDRIPHDQSETMDVVFRKVK